MKVVKTEGGPRRLEVLVDPPKYLPLSLPLRQSGFPRIIARVADKSSAPTVLIVLPDPPLGGTVVAEVSLASFLEAAALLQARYGSPGGISLAQPMPPPGGAAG